MCISVTRTALAVGVAGSLLAAPSALARGAVYGGSTNNHQAIVVRTDAKAQKHTSAVIAWQATCKGGMNWSDSAEVVAVAAGPGCQPSRDELMVSRNGRGKFAGTQLYTTFAGDLSAGIVVRISGHMTAKRASGTLTAHVTMLDSAGQEQDSCDTGSVRW